VRVVSLVPSLTDVVAQLGAAEDLVAVTEYCTDGAPADAERVGGTKNPEVARIIALRPDVVLANTEENKAEHLDRLRQAGLTVEETYPRSVADAASMTRRLGEVLGRAEQAEVLAAEVDAAREAAAWPADAPRVMALTLIWRKPWMGVGADTFADDLLWRCGFGNVLSGFDERYPTVDPSYVLGADVVLLPSEPYAFGDDDLPAVAELVGEEVPTRFVDGQALTWHGPRTAEAVRTFSELARSLTG
jgi:ABC-type hemin transport system substrate-binding protein